MCFSPQASFTIAAALGIISALSYAKAPNFKWRLLALTPLFFGIQQAIEGLVWLTLMQGDTTSLLHKGSVYGFVFFAAIFWPCWIPEIFYLLESNVKRKIFIAISQAAGVAFALNSIVQLYTHGVTAHIAEHHIAYDVHWEKQVLTHFPDQWVYTIGMTVYLIAVVLPFFVSSIPYAWLLGIIVSLGFIGAQIAYSMAFGSVWCFFAAVASLLVYFIIAKKLPKQ